MRDIFRGYNATLINERLRTYAYQLMLAADDPPDPATKMQRERKRLTDEVHRLEVGLGDDLDMYTSFIPSLIEEAPQPERALLGELLNNRAKLDAALRLLAMRGVIKLDNVDSRGQRYWRLAEDRPERRPVGRPRNTGTSAILALAVGEEYRTSNKPSPLIGANSPVARQHPERRFDVKQDHLGRYVIKRTPDEEGPRTFPKAPKRRPRGVTRFWKQIMENRGPEPRYHVVGPRYKSAGEAYLLHFTNLDAAINAAKNSPMLKENKEYVEGKEGSYPREAGRVYDDRAVLVWGEEPGSEKFRMMEEMEKANAKAR